MVKSEKSLRNFIFFWVIAIILLFGWYSYLLGNNMHLLIALSLLAGVVLGTLVYQSVEFLSTGKNEPRYQLKDEAIQLTEISRLIEQLNELVKKALKKTEPDKPAIAKISTVEINEVRRQGATPQEVKERLNQLLQNNFND